MAIKTDKAKDLTFSGPRGAGQHFGFLHSKNTSTSLWIKAAGQKELLEDVKVSRAVVMLLLQAAAGGFHYKPHSTGCVDYETMKKNRSLFLKAHQAY